MTELTWTTEPPAEHCGPFRAKLRGGKEVVVSYHATIPTSLYRLNMKTGWRCHRTRRFVQPQAFATYEGPDDAI